MRIRVSNKLRTKTIVIIHFYLLVFKRVIYTRIMYFYNTSIYYIINLREKTLKL